MKCKHCVKDCPYRMDDDCYYEPNDYNDKDIGSSTVDEIRRQNGEL